MPDRLPLAKRLGRSFSMRTGDPPAPEDAGEAEGEAVGVAVGVGELFGWGSVLWAALLSSGGPTLVVR